MTVEFEAAGTAVVAGLENDRHPDNIIAIATDPQIAEVKCLVRVGWRSIATIL
jgi:hypothetical protein